MCGGIGVVVCVVVFFFKQKTAYEMRISDWSSDVCSSDLFGFGACNRHAQARYAGSDPQWRYRGARRRVPARIDHRCVEGAVAWRYPAARLPVPQRQQDRHQARTPDLRDAEGAAGRFEGEIGRASGRERGCQYGWIWVVAVQFK